MSLTAWIRDKRFMDERSRHCFDRVPLRISKVLTMRRHALGQDPEFGVQVKDLSPDVESQPIDVGGLQRADLTDILLTCRGDLGRSRALGDPGAEPVQLLRVSQSTLSIRGPSGGD